MQYKSLTSLKVLKLTKLNANMRENTYTALALVDVWTCPLLGWVALKQAF